ncbi:MAG: hypothetical protein O3C21_03290 [Verrucomicrobia bacterium]|nr:hypothetical protein [Verrucomicrobiota bacterium]
MQEILPAFTPPRKPGLVTEWKRKPNSDLPRPSEDLFLGRSGFRDFMASPEGIPTNILSERLERLVPLLLVEIAEGSARLRFITRTGPRRCASRSGRAILDRDATWMELLAPE